MTIKEFPIIKEFSVEESNIEEFPIIEEFPAIKAGKKETTNEYLIRTYSNIKNIPQVDEEEKLKQLLSVKDYLELDKPKPLYELPSFPSPADPKDISLGIAKKEEERKPSTQEMVKAASLDNLRYIEKVMRENIPEFEPELFAEVSDEIKIKEVLPKVYADMAERPLAVLIGTDFFNKLAFNLPEYLSRKGLSPTEHLLGLPKGSESLYIRAAKRLREQIVQADPRLLTKIGVETGSILNTLIKFAMLPDVSKIAKFATLPKVIKAAIGVGTKAGLIELLKAPEVEESLLDRTSSVILAAEAGAVVGAVFSLALSGLGKVVGKIKGRIETSKVEGIKKALIERSPKVSEYIKTMPNDRVIRLRNAINDSAKVQTGTMTQGTWDYNYKPYIVSLAKDAKRFYDEIARKAGTAIVPKGFRRQAGFADIEGPKEFGKGLGKWLSKGKEGVVAKLITFRVGKPKGSMGTYYGSEQAKIGGWKKEFPLEGKDVVTIKGENITEGTAAGAPMADNPPFELDADLHKILDNTLEQTSKDPKLDSTKIQELLGSIQAKRKGVNLVHWIDTKTGKSTSLDLRDFSEEELIKSLNKELSLNKLAILEELSPVKQLTNRIKEGLKAHQFKIEPAKTKELAIRAAKMREYRDAELAKGRTDLEKILNEAAGMYKGKLLTEYLQFEPLRGKIDEEALFKVIADDVQLKARIYDQLQVKRILVKVLDGYVTTEREAKRLGEIYGFDLELALDKRIRINKAAKVATKLASGKALNVEEAALLSRFNPELRKEAWKAVPFEEKTLLVLKQLWFVPRTLVFGGDISYALRQAILDLYRHPIMSAKAFDKARKAYGIPVTKKRIQALEDLTKNLYKELTNSPHFAEAFKSGIIHEVRGVGEEIVFQEIIEYFAGAELVERIPLIGNFYRSGERAWVTGLNAIRMKVFEYERSYIIDPETDKLTVKQLEILGRKILSETGEAPITKGRLRTVASTIMLAPKFTKSSIINPFLPLKGIFSKDPDVKKLAKLSADKWIAFIGGNIAIMIALKLAFGDKAEIITNPTSPHVGKVKIGKHHIDLWGPYLVPFRLYMKLLTGIKTTTAGRKRKVNRRKEILRFARSKLEPFLGFITDIFITTNYIGEPVGSPPKKTLIPGFEKLPEGVQGWSREAYNRFFAMFLQDSIDAVNEDGLLRGLVSGPLAGGFSFLGGGIASYEDRTTTRYQKMQDVLSFQEYEKGWEDLTPLQQRILTGKHSELNELYFLAKGEREAPANIQDLTDEQFYTGKRIRQSLPKDVQVMLKDVGITTIQISRRLGNKFYLNDKRYEFYENEVIRRLNTPGGLKGFKWADRAKERPLKEKRVKEHLDRIRKEARTILMLHINRKGL